MPDLEQRLRALAGDVEWPPAPPLALQLDPARAAGRRRPRPVVLAFAAVAIAVAVALSVPTARSAILRILHLGGVTVEHVGVLPPAQERPLAADLGPSVSSHAAAAALGAPVRAPKLHGTPVLHLRDGVVSVLLATPDPVLLSELRSDFPLLKKIAGSETHVLSLEVGNGPGLWITGARHLVVLPAAPPRLAGNTLIWVRGSITYRLEGRDLDKATALALAAEIDGT